LPDLKIHLLGKNCILSQKAGVCSFKTTFRRLNVEQTSQTRSVLQNSVHGGRGIVNEVIPKVQLYKKVNSAFATQDQFDLWQSFAWHAFIALAMTTEKSAATCKLVN
jgi:hypothetical protein